MIPLNLIPADETSRKGELHLSELFTCLRKRYYEYQGEVPEFTVIEKGRMYRGKIYEKYVIEQIAEHYPRQTRKQMKVVYKDVIGHPDLWISPTRTIAEIKSTEKIPDKPWPDQEHQTLNYLYCYKPALQAVIIYIHPSTLETKQVEYTHNQITPEYAQSVDSDIDLAKHVVCQPDAPDKNQKYDPEKPPCMYHTRKGDSFCPFYQKCWTKDESKIAVFVMDNVHQILQEWFFLDRQAKEHKEFIKNFEDRREELIALLNLTKENQIVKAGEFELRKSSYPIKEQIRAATEGTRYTIKAVEKAAK